MRKLYPEEIERAKRAKPLPLDASWATGDEAFDARIHASLMQRDEAVRMLVEFVDFMQSADVSFGDDEDEAEVVLGKAVDFIAKVTS